MRKYLPDFKWYEFKQLEATEQTAFRNEQNSTIKDPGIMKHLKRKRNNELLNDKIKNKMIKEFLKTFALNVRYDTNIPY